MDNLLFIGLIVFVIMIIVVLAVINIKKFFLQKNKRVFSLDTLFSIINFILNGILPTMALVWALGLFVQVIHAENANDLSIFLDYATVASTFFGFTLLGSIFEYKNKHSKVLNKMFLLNINFLISTICFFYIYSYMPLFEILKDKKETVFVILNSSVSYILLIGIGTFVWGILLLFRLLLDHFREQNSKKEIEPKGNKLGIRPRKNTRKRFNFENLTGSLVKSVIYLIFGVTAVCLGIYFLNHSNSIKPTPEFKNYDFNLRVTPTSAYINQYTLFYDFKYNTGNISFSINSETFEHLELWIPTNINYTKTILKSNTQYVYKENEDYKVESQTVQNTKNFILIEKIKNLDKLDEVVIQLKGNSFYPNGEFAFLFMNTARPAYLNGFFKFNKGDYECNSICFFNYINDLGFIPNQESLVYLKVKEGADDNPIGYQWFYLNMVDQSKVYKKQIEYALAVSLFISGLFSIIESFALFIGDGLVSA